MASIHREALLDVSVDEAWAALRQVGNVHQLFAPVLTEAKLDGDTRTVRFANGMLVRERIIDIDEQRHRVAYSAQSGTPMTHHHASMQVLEAGPGHCRFRWISDFLPDSVAPSVEPLIEQGTRAFKENLENGPSRKSRAL